MNHFNHRKSRI